MYNDNVSAESVLQVCFLLFILPSSSSSLVCEQSLFCSRIRGEERKNTKQVRYSRGGGGGGRGVELRARAGKP